jgi:hypothetical protein
VQNAVRDGAEWAWVPSGDSCAFCIALASRGWETASQKALKGNHAQHIHANCDCTYAIRFDGESKYESYNPAKYKEIYDNASDGNSYEKINAIRREQYKLNKDEINASKRINYESLKSRIEGKTVAKSGKDGIIDISSASLPTVTLPKKEYAHVMSEIATNLTAEQKQKSVFEKSIGKYIYTVENKGFGEYRIIGKKDATQENIDKIW